MLTIDKMQLDFVGIDPGKHGGIVMMDMHGKVTFSCKMPLLKNGDYDMDGIEKIASIWWLEIVPRAHITIEKLHAMPLTMGGSIANYERGYAMGWVWMLKGIGTTPSLVDPRTWQKEMLVGCKAQDTKARALIAATRLWGDADWFIPKRCRKPHDGIIDAALICEFGRRRYNATV